jgi:ubiquinone/menaquinone biosynthesis C-methylase UbiE
MSKRVCPWWLGYTLILPIRRLQHDPARLLAPYIREGMTVLEPGPGMGYFTLELARRVGPAGRVIAVDIQPKMLAALRRRAAKAGLLPRVEIREARPASLGIDDVTGADFALAFAVVHEMPDPESFFAQMARALKPGAGLLLAEPTGHVKPDRFAAELNTAERVGFTLAGQPPIQSAHSAFLKKN